MAVFTGCQVESDDEPEKKTFTVIFNTNGGSGEMKPQSAEEGTEITLTANAFTRDGYTFSGWNTAADGKGTDHADKSTIKLTADITLYAQWTEIGKVEKVTFSATGDVDYNEKITLSCGTDSAAIYYALVTGTDAPTAEEFSSSKQKYSEPIAITENAVVAAVAVKDGMKDSEIATATFTVKTYTVTFETAHGTAPAKIEGLKKGYKLTEEQLKALEDITGYKFDGWFNGETQFTAETEITSNLTLTAKWTAVSYKIIYNNVENASNSNPETYTIENETITLVAPTKDGSDFIGWYSEASFENEVTKIAKGTTGDITLYAKFITNSLLFYSQKWNYADDEFGLVLPAKLELKRSIAAGDTLGAPFAEDAVAFCTAGIWGEDDTVVYYVDGDYALWSYSADGTKTLVKEAVAGATDAFVSYDSEGKCLFALYDSDNAADKKIFVKDTVSGKSFTTAYGNYVVLTGDITAIAGSKKDSSFFISNGRGSKMSICLLEFSSNFSTMLDAGSEFSDEITGGEIFGLGSEAPFTTTLKKDPIQYKITDMTVIGGKLYALFASCFEQTNYVYDDYGYYYPLGNYSTAGGVLRINYSDNLFVDTTFGTGGIAGYSENVKYESNNDINNATYLLPYPVYNSNESTFSTEWPTARINSNLEFNNPQKIIAIKPDELVIAENGLALTVDDNDNNYRKHYNLARAVTMDLNGKIKSVTAVHGKSFSYGGWEMRFNDGLGDDMLGDGLVVSSIAKNTELHNDISFE